MAGTGSVASDRPIVFDEDGDIRVMKRDKFTETSALKDECGGFTES